jgi:hypothetical protein
MGGLSLGIPPRPHPAIGGGAQALENNASTLMDDLWAVVEEPTGGHPMGPQK